MLTLMQQLTVKTLQECRQIFVGANSVSDEIHRLDKIKQDFLLLLLESGLVMIGATTENPFFSVTPAIRSRIQILSWNR